MSPERQIFGQLQDFIDRCNAMSFEGQRLREEAIVAFYEDHPEVEMLCITTRPFTVKLRGAQAYVSAEAITDPKLKKCLEIMEELFSQI